MRIGIDFDNTLVGYDELFRAVAIERGLLPSTLVGGKKALRDMLRLRPGGEDEWTRLQADVYGRRMADARIIEGASSFIGACRANGAEVFVVSHKTRHAAADPSVDLHQSSLAWMEAHGFFDPARLALTRGLIFFEPTRDAKCRRIAQLGCTHFIDDLEEVFQEPSFPPGVERLLLHRASEAPPRGPFATYSDWNAISDAIFDAAR